MIRKRERARTGVTDAEEIELRIGPPPDGQSVFADSGEAANAWLALSRLDAERSKMGRLLAAGPVLAEQYRRHDLHADRAPLPFPEWPAYVDTDLCPLCPTDALAASVPERNLS